MQSSTLKIRREAVLSCSHVLREMKYENLEELLLPGSQNYEEEIDDETAQPCEHSVHTIKPLAKYFESVRLLNSDAQVIERVLGVIDYFLQIDACV